MTEELFWFQVFLSPMVMFVLEVVVRVAPEPRKSVSDSDSESEITTMTLALGPCAWLGGEMRLLLLNGLRLECELAKGVLACELMKLMAASCGCC